MADALPKTPPDIPKAGSPLASAEKELKVLREFVIHLMGITDIDDLCWYVAKEVVGRLGFTDCVVYRFDDERDVLVQSAAIGEKNPEQAVITNKLVIPLGKGITGQVAKTGQPEIVGDLGKDARYIVDLVEAQSEICVPLVHDGKILGVIDCEDPGENYFTEKHLESLTAIASITSAHIVQCQMMDQLTKLSADLKVALRKSQDAQRAQATFLANVSHELRTPLNAIVGFSTIFAEGRLTENDIGLVVDYGKHINNAGLHLTTIVNDILDIAALSSKKTHPDIREIDLLEKIDAASNLVSNKATQQGAVINVRAPAGCSTGLFDPRHFTQIMTNLLDNAVKYGKAGAPIYVSVSRKGNDALAVAVQDFGIGISDAALGQIFEPFCRDQAVVNRGIEGTGLGLCLAKELALANGGDIHVESVSGEGSTFTLTLPLAS